MKYLLGSGYYDSARNPGAAEFFPIWLENIKNHANPAPDRIVVMAVGDSRCPKGVIPNNLEWIELSGNCGHLHQLIGKEKPAKSHQLTGWSAAMLALAMTAYANETDFVYWEQDCLCFGNVIEQMYEDMGDADMVFGAKMGGPPYMACAQALFLVRHKFIPQFVLDYLFQPRDGEDGKEGQMTTESKFAALADINPEKYRHLSFGVDRERPWPEIGPFYVQQLTKDEMKKLRKGGWI